MRLINYTSPSVLIAEKGYQLLENKIIKDVYDAEGNLVEPEEPHYFTIAFVPDDATHEQCEAKYIEVKIE